MLDGSIKLDIYRKPTHTNQNLQFSSHRPLHQKLGLGVVRTLSERLYHHRWQEQKEERRDHKSSTDHLRLSDPMSKVKKDEETPKPNATTSTKSNDTQNNTKHAKAWLLSRTWRASRIASPASSRNMLLHSSQTTPYSSQSQRQKGLTQSADMVYEIPCNSCTKTYVGETTRIFKTRLGEHKKEAEKFSDVKYTRSKAQELESYVFKSAAAEHAMRQKPRSWVGQG